jgi:lycopene beta-cyclase
MPQNSANLQVDIAILGGGLAGLSLAAELAAPQFAHLNIVVIEPRQVYTRDKTWSYWRVERHAFSTQESAVWQAWQVQNVQKTVTIDSKNAENYVYSSLNSDDFYTAAIAKIKVSSHIQLLLGESVAAISANQNQAEISLKSGTKIVVNQTIFDSRPAINASQNRAKQHHLTQHFFGVEIVTVTPVFNTNQIMLMDFQTSNHGIHFLYVLPYSPKHALVETTWICDHHKHDDYEQELQDYLQKKWPTIQFKTHYSEVGALPLMPCEAHVDWLAAVPIIPIGSLAGTARAATGYAFLETLADSARLANLIGQNLPLTAFKRNKMDAWMDAVFLSFLSQHANLAADYFVQMFANCQPARLIRFLTGQANWLDRISVMRAMPAKPILKHLLANILKN